MFSSNKGNFPRNFSFSHLLLFLFLLSSFYCHASAQSNPTSSESPNLDTSSVGNKVPESLSLNPKASEGSRISSGTEVPPVASASKPPPPPIEVPIIDTQTSTEQLVPVSTGGVDISIVPSSVENPETGIIASSAVTPATPEPGLARTPRRLSASKPAGEKPAPPKTPANAPVRTRSSISSTKTTSTVVTPAATITNEAPTPKPSISSPPVRTRNPPRPRATVSNPSPPSMVPTIDREIPPPISVVPTVVASPINPIEFPTPPSAPLVPLIPIISSTPSNPNSVVVNTISAPSFPPPSAPPVTPPTTQVSIIPTVPTSAATPSAPPSTAPMPQPDNPNAVIREADVNEANVSFKLADNIGADAPADGDSSKKVTIIAAATASSVFLISGLTGIVFFYRRKKNKAKATSIFPTASMFTDTMSTMEQEIYTVYIPYVPELEDELELAAGDQVMIQERFQDKWVLGTNLTTGETGCFPFLCLDSDAASSIASEYERTSSLMMTNKFDGVRNSINTLLSSD